MVRVSLPLVAVAACLGVAASESEVVVTDASAPNATDAGIKMLRATKSVVEPAVMLQDGSWTGEANFYESLIKCGMSETVNAVMKSYTESYDKDTKKTTSCMQLDKKILLVTKTEYWKVTKDCSSPVWESTRETCSDDQCTTCVPVVGTMKYDKIPDGKVDDGCMECNANLVTMGGAYAPLYITLKLTDTKSGEYVYPGICPSGGGGGSGGKSGGGSGMIIAVVVVLLLLAAGAVGFIMWRKKQNGA